MSRQVVMLNDYLVLVRDRAKKKTSEQALFTVPTQSSGNVGKVLFSSQSEDLVGRVFYFKNQFDTMIFEGQEALIMKYENLVAEVKE